jgi:hypothetical protein
MIWDLHCHITDGILGSGTPEERLGRLISIADRFEIDRLCLYMGVRSRSSDTSQR